MSIPSAVLSRKYASEENEQGRWLYLRNSTGADAVASDVVRVRHLGTGTDPQEFIAIVADALVYEPAVVDHQMHASYDDFNAGGGIKSTEYGWVKVKGPIIAKTAAALNPTAGHGVRIVAGALNTTAAVPAHGSTEIGVFKSTGAANSHSIILHGDGPKTAVVA